MGRNKTGSICVSEAKRIELSFLLRSRLIRKGCVIESVLSWTCRDLPTGSIKIICSYTDENKSIKLVYKLTDLEGVQKRLDYEVRLSEVDSNLVKGKVLYMMCPESGKRCRNLYLAYDSEKFKSRNAYQNRLYYDTQKCSKIDYWQTKYLELESKLGKLKSNLRTKTYLGKPTKRKIRFDRIERTKIECDLNRWSKSGMTKSMWRDLNTEQYMGINPYWKS